jgi:transcriptional regulator with XRE-family HTH domain
MVNYYYLMEKEFGVWLQEEILRRGLTQTQFSQVSGVTPSQISRIISGSRGVGEKTLQAIASGLNLPTEDVFRAAGFLPAQKESDPFEEQLRELISRLPKEKIPIVMELFEAYVAKTEKEENLIAIKKKAITQN